VLKSQILLHKDDAMKPIVLAAGGTGGHLFPAEALARELTARGHAVELISDERVAPFADRFPARAIHKVISGTVTGKGFFGKIGGGINLVKGILQCTKILKTMDPAIVVGFGGYPTVPPLLAAQRLKLPTALHEQNAVMGRANRFLASRVGLVASGFPLALPDIAQKLVHVGNPVRQSVIEAASLPMPSLGEGASLQLCIFGGSQGARVMSDVVPTALASLPEAYRKKLRVVQQAREEDRDRVIKAYHDAGIAAEIENFFSDMPGRIAASHLVIARGGASTVAELSVIGRGAIIVPLPGALDQDQAANGRVLEKAGGARVVMQPAFTAAALTDMLLRMISDPSTLEGMAKAAKMTGMPQAASSLADYVLKHAKF
jgi:UDP-N-acetylglucosamine--N-acetylmuramyl-(pentapeptide) pyrophosphoryl-undecaprenol N-acetylglucosamine transferase